MRTLRLMICLLSLAGCQSSSDPDGPPTAQDANAPARAMPRAIFTLLPSTGVAGVALEPTVQVTLVDEAGTAMPRANDAVSLAIASGPRGATLTGGESVVPSRGVAIFPSVRVDKVGTYTFIATLATSGATAISSALSITVGPPSRLAFVSQPADTAAGDMLEPVQVAVEDALGNVVTGAFDDVTLSVRGGPADATLSGMTTVTAMNGIATFPNLSLDRAPSTYTFITAAAGLTSAESAPFAVTSGPPSAATSILFASPTSVAVPGSIALTVIVDDALGNPVSNANVLFGVSGSGNTLSASGGTTNASGRLSVTLSSTHAEPKSVTAAIGPSLFTLSTSVTFNAGAPSAATSTFTAAPTTLPTGQKTTLVLRINDSWGNPVANQPVSISATGTGNTITPASGATNGSGLFTATLVSTHPGTRTVAASFGPITLTADVTFVAPTCIGALRLPGVPEVDVGPAYAAASGDFNGDTKPDLIVGNSGGTVSLMLGNGDGTFQAPRISASGGRASAITTGDYNRDGHLDVAIISANGVTLLLNSGSGLFFPSPTIQTGSQSIGIITGDFNNDGRPDLATVNSDTRDVSVIIGNGDGTFHPPLAYATGKASFAIAAGDFNRDGNLDLVVTNRFDGTLSVLLNDGSGAFTSATTYSAGTGRITVADFNRDDRLDVAVLASPGDTVQVFPGHGDGTLDSPSVFTDAKGPVAITTADFNRDGRPDLATLNGDGISVFLGEGNGSFGPPATSATAMSFTVVGGDFNLDGIPDLAAVNRNLLVQTGTADILLGNGDGTFPTLTSSSVGAAPASVASGDFNGDGKADVATASNADNSISVLAGRGDGTFAAQRSFAAGTAPHAIATADLDGDGRLDLVATNYGDSTVGVLRGNGDATFASQVPYTVGSKPIALTIADLNGDGRPDVVTANLSSLSVLLNAGGGVFTNAMTLTTLGNPSGITSADFDGDGRLDIALSNHGNTASVLPGNGDGTFQPELSFPIAGSNPFAITSADFDGDGTADLATANFGNGTASVLLGYGDGTFPTQTTYTVGSGPQSVISGDLDGDGRPDLIIGNLRDNTVSVLVGNGNGTFRGAFGYPGGDEPRWLATADFNRDGRTDVAVANGGSNTVSVLPNRGCIP